MKRVALVAFALLALAVVASLCSEQQTTEPESSLGEIEPLPLDLPGHRSFRMGFAYQPYDWSEEAFKATYDFVADHGDLIVHYMDDGVPWEQALNKTPYPEEFEKDLDRRASQRRPKQAVVAVVNALGVDRTTIAAVWGEGNTLDFSTMGKGTTRWAGRSLGDAETIRAFGNYCERIIDRLQPDYFFYSGEVNASYLSLDDPNYQAFRALAAAVYSRLKRRYPKLPVSLEFVLADKTYMAQRKAVGLALMPYTDLIGVSTYPFVPEASPNIKGDASKLPDDWFQPLSELSPHKGIGIVESGFNGAPISYWDRRIPGNESSQNRFVQFLLREASHADFEFVAWWVHRDYDLLWDKLKAGGADDAFNQWRTTGLLDGKGRPRQALHTWDQWLGVPLRGDTDNAP